MPVYSTLIPHWLYGDRHNAVISLSAISLGVTILGLNPSPLYSAPLPTLQSPHPPLITPQRNGVSLPSVVPVEVTPRSNPVSLPTFRPDGFATPQIAVPPATPPIISEPSPEAPPAFTPPTLSFPVGSSVSPAVESPPPPLKGTTPVLGSPYESDTYRLSIGDSISVFVANVPEFTTKNVIMSDGTINLPIAGSISLWGMTLAEASQAVTQRYVQTDVLRNPFIAVQLLASSPLKIALSGAINRPGAYNIPVVDTKLPTLTDAISLAGGIAGGADLRQVKVYRLGANGTDQVLEVNLWALIQSADLRQDITLRSGDRILLAKAPVKPEEANLMGSANLSAPDMQVGILGEVLAPGLIKVPPNTSLNQALLLVGGFNKRAQRKTVELIRSNEDGTVTRQKYTVNWSDPISETSNPMLQKRDVILVGSSTLARYGDILGKIVSPISQSFSFLSFFNFLFPAGK